MTQDRHNKPQPSAEPIPADSAMGNQAPAPTPGVAPRPDVAGDSSDELPPAKED